MKKILIVCAVITLVMSCNKKEIKTANTEKNDIENNRWRDDLFDLDDPDYVIDLFSGYGTIKTDDFAEMYENYTIEKTQLFNINATEATTITGEQGTKVFIGENNFINFRGFPVSGEIQIELIEVFNRADMVLLDRSTSGISEDGESVVTLVSGGEIFIRATQGGSEVDIIDPITIIVSVSEADEEMLKFVDAGLGGDQFLWKVAEGEEMAFDEDGFEGDILGIGDIGADANRYRFNIIPGRWGWTNIDRWAGDPCAKTSISVEVPSGYDETNTEVYLSYDGEANKLANFDRWDGVLFTEHYGQICIGLECHFIIVSNRSGSLEYAIQGTTVVDGHSEVISSLTAISEEDLIAEINGLP